MDARYPDHVVHSFEEQSPHQRVHSTSTHVPRDTPNRSGAAAVRKPSRSRREFKWIGKRLLILLCTGILFWFLLAPLLRFSQYLWHASSTQSPFRKYTSACLTEGEVETNMKRMEAYMKWHVDEPCTSAPEVTSSNHNHIVVRDRLNTSQVYHLFHLELVSWESVHRSLFPNSVDLTDMSPSGRTVFQPKSLYGLALPFP